jgi:hypothetical protein
MCNNSQIDSDWLANVIRGSVAPGTTRSSLLNWQTELYKVGERILLSATPELSSVLDASRHSRLRSQMAMPILKRSMRT